jgi:hypothetical protein
MMFVFPPRKNKDRLQTEQADFQVPRVHNLYVDCTILWQGHNTEETLPLHVFA